MVYAEIILSFFIGGVIILFLGWLFSIKKKGLFSMFLNTAAGGLALILLSLFKVAALPVNPLNALIVGFLGVPGLAVIYIITTLL